MAEPAQYSRAKLLFATCGRWSNSAACLLQSLRRLDAAFDIEAHDVEAKIISGWRARLVALPHALSHGGLAVFRGGGAFKDAIKNTPGYIRRVGGQIAAAARSAACNHALIIGTLSPGDMLDCPYFLYTDMPILGNREFPDGQQRIDYWRKCLPLEQRNLAGAARVFTMSQFARRVLYTDYDVPEEKVICVGAGCNSPVPACHEHDTTSRDVLFVGLDWHRKGGPDLLAAFRRVRQRVPGATLTIVGCSPEIDEPRVTVVGRVRPEELSHYYRQAAVFAMVSRREPFGIVYLEAMSAGLPVVASDRAAAPEMVREGQTGYCVPPGDIRLLAERLEQLLGDPQSRANMGQCGRMLVQREFTWETTARRIVQYLPGGNRHDESVKPVAAGSAEIGRGTATL